MFEPRQSLELLLESDKLDSLLQAARERTAKLAGVEAGDPEQLEAEISRLQEEAADVQAKSAEVADELIDDLRARELARQEKVAVVLHILHVGSRLVE